MRIPAPRHSLAVLVVLLLAGCAGQRVAPLAEAPPAPGVPPRPSEPVGLPALASIPALGPDGAYRTPNYRVSSAQAMWNVRAALNVAALGCRGADEAALIAGYNAVLARQKAPLAAAYKSVRAEDRAQLGVKWEEGHDQQMTRLYNFFAQPFAKQDFCITASAVMTRAATVDPATFASFAVVALDELEAPFIAGYRRYAAYHEQLAAWDAAYGAGPNAAPRLAYAPFETILAWTPPARGERMAMRR